MCYKVESFCMCYKVESFCMCYKVESFCMCYEVESLCYIPQNSNDHWCSNVISERLLYLMFHMM